MAQVQRVAELETRAKQLEEEAGDPAALKEKLALIELAGRRGSTRRRERSRSLVTS